MKISNVYIILNIIIMRHNRLIKIIIILVTLLYFYRFLGIPHIILLIFYVDMMTSICRLEETFIIELFEICKCEQSK